MDQLGLDFSKNVNQRVYSVEENQQIADLVSGYKKKKNNVPDEIILTQLFYEVFCVEVVKTLKSDNYFEGNWLLSESDLALDFYNFIKEKTLLEESSIIEFILIFIRKQEVHINRSSWTDNDVKKFDFDRKITQGFINLIIEGEIEKAILLYIGYVKIWNFFSIYNKPFNNLKASLIHRILADALWPKQNITFDNFANIESKVLSFFRKVNLGTIYLPFFDKENREYYLEPYLTTREKLRLSINSLFDFDNTDESESYAVLIESLKNGSSEEIQKKYRDLIKMKVEGLMYPTTKDVDFFCNLYKDSEHKNYGKWLLSQFYFYDKIRY